MIKKLFPFLFTMFLFAKGPDTAPPAAPAKPQDPPADPPPQDPPQDPGSGDKDQEDTKTKGKSVPYDRFKEVNDAKKAAEEKAAKLEEEKNQRELEEMQKKQQFEEIANKANEEKEKAIKEKTDIQNKFQEAQIKNQIKFEAMQLGIADPDDAIKMVSRDGIEIDDAGTITGVKENLEKLKETKPYLFNDGNGNKINTWKDRPKPAHEMTRDELLKNPTAASELYKKDLPRYNKIMGYPEKHK